MSDTFPRNGKGAVPALLLLAAALLLSGCPVSTNRPNVTKASAELLEAKGDKAIERAVRRGGQEPFAIIALFRKDVFTGQSRMLDRSSIPILDELGNAALLLVRPHEVLPLLSDPSLVKAAWFGPQGRLARLDPSLELDLLDRFAKGTESGDTVILARFRSIPQAAEEQAVGTAGFKVLTRGGPNLLISGPMSGIPRLLGNDWIVYLEKGIAP